MARAQQFAECPTCQLVRGIMMGAKVPRPVTEKVAYSRPVRAADKVVKAAVKKKASEYQQKLSKHLKKERAKATKKNGDFKKGWDQARVMKAAHKCVKKEMRR